VLEAAQGKVALIGVPEANLTSTSAVVSFVAPDSMGCPVDYSASDSNVITSFTRVSDSGGARSRNITLSGLTPGTVYHYRVNCAVQQPTGQFRTR
jgi:phosphodiesterase/alkaline phosphatase D-like protein